MKSSIRALNQLVTQAVCLAFLFAVVMTVAQPAFAGNRLVARSCDAGVATILAPVQAYTAPSCSQNAPLQQRELGDPTYNACPQAQPAAIVDYGTTQRYTVVPQIQRYQLQQIQTPRAQKVLLVQNNNHAHLHAQALQRQQFNQIHHHNVAAIRTTNRHSVAAVRAANRAIPNRTVTKTVTRQSRR